MKERLFLRKVAAVPFTLFLLLFTMGHLQARLISVLSIQEISKKADVVVVGKVTAIRSASASQADELQWRAPLFQMTATVQVLRSYGKGGEVGVMQGSELSIPYLALDLKRLTDGIIDGPHFPRLAVGDIFAFPLAEASSGKLIQEEDFGMLMPCAAEPPMDTGSRAECLWSELRQTFACGSYEGIRKAAHFLGFGFDGTATKPKFNQLLDQLDGSVGANEARWLQIGVAAYCASGVPRPPIADLPANHPTAQMALANRAFGHVEPKDFDARVIREAMKHIDAENWGTFILISENYPQNVLAMRLITDALAGGDPNAISMADMLIRGKDHSLVSSAVQASVKYLTKPVPGDFGLLRSATHLIVQYGNEGDFAFFLDQLRKAQKEDKDRYTSLWASCEEDNPRLPEVCRVVIDDKRLIDKNDRFCDRAVWALERTQKLHFGTEYGRNPDNSLIQSEPERDTAVEKAKAWLNRPLSKSP